MFSPFPSASSLGAIKKSLGYLPLCSALLVLDLLLRLCRAARLSGRQAALRVALHRQRPNHEGQLAHVLHVALVPPRVFLPRHVVVGRLGVLDPPQNVLGARERDREKGGSLGLGAGSAAKCSARARDKEKNK